MSSQKRWTLIAAILGSGIVFLDSTVVNVALPKIGEDLKSGFLGPLAAESFVYYGYLLSLSALLILAGALNDYYGRRRMFIIGLIGFLATSVMCGVAPNIELLIAFRVLQGAAGALLVPGSLALITATFEGEEQGRAFGLWAGASAGTTILGPFVGGLLVEIDKVGPFPLSWRAAFLINIPLLLFALYATVRHVAESRDETATGQFDWLGAVVVFLAVGGLSFGAIIGQQENWHGTLPYISLVVGAISAVAFPILMMRSKHPLVPLELFRSRNFTVTNISTLVIYGALYVTFQFQAIFLIGTVGYTPAAVGLVGIPGSLFLVLFSSRFGKLAAKFGPRLFMTVGPAIMGLGILWFVRIPPTTEPWNFDIQRLSTWVPPGGYVTDLLPGIVLFGIGLMIMVAPLTTALMTSVPSQHSGVASAVNNAISRVGPQLAGALIFVAIATSFYHGISSRVPGVDTSAASFRSRVAPLNPPSGDVSPELEIAAREASTDSFRLAMLLAAGLLFVGALVNAVGIRNPQGPAWMRRPKGADGQAIHRMGQERPAATAPVPTERQQAPPWMDSGTS